jgi:two-component system, sensor histidine kinase and response regulator
VHKPQSRGWHFVLDKPARILVADDDPIFCEFASVHISSPVVEVVTVRDGAQAWSRLCSEAFDIALLDIEMPQLDGFEVTRRVRDNPVLAHLPVVVITGHEDIQSVDQAYELGATSFAAKPVNWRLLTYQLRYVMRTAQIERDIRLARDDAEQISALKSDALARLQCEIEAPLSAIVVAVEGLSLGDNGEFPRALAECLQSIRSAGQQALNTLNAMTTGPQSITAADAQRRA